MDIIFRFCEILSKYEPHISRLELRYHIIEKYFDRHNKQKDCLKIARICPTYLFYELWEFIQWCYLKIIIFPLLTWSQWIWYILIDKQKYIINVACLFFMHAYFYIVFQGLWKLLQNYHKSFIQLYTFHVHNYKTSFILCLIS